LRTFKRCNIINLLLNLKRLHLSKSNKTYLLTTPAFAGGSVDQFFPSNTGESAEHTAADLSKFDEITRIVISIRIGGSDRFQATCPSVSVTGSASDHVVMGSQGDAAG
jgi:hypothetical protein